MCTCEESVGKGRGVSIKLACCRFLGFVFLEENYLPGLSQSSEMLNKTFGSEGSEAIRGR